MIQGREIKYLFLSSMLLMLCVSAPFYHQSVFAQPSRNAVQEQVLRAHLIINLLRYVTWEKHAEEPAAPVRLNICTAGNPSSTTELQKLHGVKINTQTVSVIAAEKDKWATCDVLVYGDELQKTETRFDLHTPLMICDSCSPDHIPSAIRIVRIEEEQSGSTVVRNGFEVDLQPAKDAGVSFGSDLLAHAIQVKGL